MNMPTISQTKVLVRAALAAKTDRSGEPLWKHCYNVCARLDENASPAQRHVALLHDILEDSDLTSDDLLRCGYPTRIVRAVVLLTARAGEPYPSYITRLLDSRDTLALMAKLADNLDNTDPARLGNLSEHAQNHLKRRYFGVQAELRSALDRLGKPVTIVDGNIIQCNTEPVLI